LINITGLAIGLAACTLIILFIEHEFSYDTQFSDLDNVYRIETTANIPGQQSNEVPTFFGPAFDLLPADFDEIETVVRLQQRAGTVVKGDSSTPETFATVDPMFLNVFDFPMIEGDRASALDQPSAVVLTEEMAIKHLGSPPWIGKTIEINETIEREMKVTGVIETLPDTTHFDIDFLIPIDRRVYDQAGGPLGGSQLDQWNSLPFNVYVKLKEGRDPDALSAGLNDWVDRHFPDRIRTLVGINGSELFTPRLMPVRDIHMFSPVQFDMKTPGSISSIYSFSGIALLILAIASINFMNLSTATSTLRAKEVAMRKVMGANRRQLFAQFEVESVVLAIISLFFALVIIELILPSFSDYTQRALSTASLFEPIVMLAIFSLTLVIGLGAGLHPAIVISSFRPSRVLQSNKSAVSGSATLRAALVLFQFAISAALIILTLLMYVQTDYARSMNMGYDNETKLTIRGLFAQQIGDRAERVRDEVARIPGVSKVSLHFRYQGRMSGSSFSIDRFIRHSMNSSKSSRWLVGCWMMPIRETEPFSLPIRILSSLNP
jgi:putative ABC transport system permease protein